MSLDFLVIRWEYEHIDATLDYCDPVLVLFLNHHNDDRPGSALQVTNDFLWTVCEGP